MIEYSAGIVTAYGSAVRAGYTGTYEDFCRQQAQYADNASAVEQAKQTAVSASQSANQAKQDAQTASTTAQSASQSAQGSAQSAGQSAQDAQTAKNNAQTYAQSASQSAGSAQQSAQSAQSVLESIPEDYSDLAEDVDKLRADLDDLDDNINFSRLDSADISMWEQGVIAVTNGLRSPTQTRIRTQYISTVFSASAAIGYQFGVYVYDTDDIYIGVYDGTNIKTNVQSTPWLSTVNLLALKNYNIKLCAKKTDGTNISPADAVNIVFLFVTDATLSHAGIPADAAVVGEQTERLAQKWGNLRYIKMQSLLQNIKGVNKFLNNLVNPLECVDNYFINTSNGDTAPSASYFCSGFIPVTGGIEYRANLGRNLAWYNNSKEYISGVNGTTIQTGVTAPENAAFIRFTVNKSSDATNDPFDLYFSSVSTFNADVTIPNLVVYNVKPWCYGKKINWIGDSIVDGSDFDEVVCNALELIKMTTDGVDGGINGSTIALKADGTDGRNALCLRYSNMPNDADIIAVSCGTNDFQYAWCPIGDIDSISNSTFYGALKTLCEGLINKYPQKLIFFTTPIKRAQAFENGNGGEYTADGVMTTPFSKNKYGKTLGDYADIIKEVCGYYSIPVLDMYRESLLNPHLASQQNMFDNVFTHPNTVGQKIMARRIAGWITQLGYLIN